MRCIDRSLRWAIVGSAVAGSLFTGGTARADTFAAMYPELERFHAQRARVDPDGVLRSDLGRRVGLCGVAP